MMFSAEPMVEPRQNEPMLPLLVRHKIQILRDAGHSQRDTARRAGVSLKTVQRVEGEPLGEQTDDEAAHRARQIGRPSKAQPFVDQVKTWLSKEPDLPTLEVLRLATLAGYRGKKSAFYALVGALRPKPTTPLVRFEGLPGEFSQHDFGEVDVRFVSGVVRRVLFFISRLKFSRFSAVTIVANQRVETLVRTLALHFVAFGGLPLLAVFDRPKTIVVKGGVGREVLEWNQTFAQAIVDLGVGVEMCAPRSGNQKGSGERLVGWVKNSFFKCRRFLDDHDLGAQLEAWLLEGNTERPCRATGEIPEARRQQELPRLRPIKVGPAELALRVPIVVSPSAEVLFESVPYSMPSKASNLAGTMYVYAERLKIVAGRFEVEHPRRSRGKPAAPLPEHRRDKVDAVRGARAKLYAKRQYLLELCVEAGQVLEEIVHRDPVAAAPQIEALYTLLDVHGDEPMRGAFRAAAQARDMRVEAVERHLHRARSAEHPQRPSEPAKLASPFAAPPAARVTRRGGRP